MSNPLILLHGYSDRGASYRTWRKALEGKGYDVTSVHTCDYETLTNEITIRDIAEGFDRALREHAGLSEKDEFDAIVHSTGMLVIRSWLASYASRRSRLKHLIGLAPATFGSPLAHKGRSWLGALFKGRKVFGPDFLEAGDLVLDGLELASRFTWDLAHQDLVGEAPVYGPSSDTPFVFVFCGTEGYGGIRKLMSEPGSDGTVRLAGCALNTRKIVLDLTVHPGESDAKDQTRRFQRLPEWADSGERHLDATLMLVPDANHGSILSDPSDTLIDMVTSALSVTSRDEWQAWHERPAVRAAAELRSTTGAWQQFVVRMVDERGDPVPDYNMQMFRRGTGKRQVEEFDLKVHTYRDDSSFRCFHVDLEALKPDRLDDLYLNIIASSGSTLVGYHGMGSEKIDDAGEKIRKGGKWDAVINLTPLLDGDGFKLFYPFTTTLIEIKINREPLPLRGEADIFRIR